MSTNDFVENPRIRQKVDNDMFLCAFRSADVFKIHELQMSQDIFQIT